MDQDIYIPWTTYGFHAIFLSRSKNYCTGVIWAILPPLYLSTCPGTTTTVPSYTSFVLPRLCLFLAVCWSQLYWMVPDVRSRLTPLFFASLRTESLKASHSLSLVYQDSFTLPFFSYCFILTPCIYSLFCWSGIRIWSLILRILPFLMRVRRRHEWDGDCSSL